MPARRIRIEVVYALAHRAESRAMTVPSGCTIAEAIAESGLEATLGLDLSGNKVGIFGRLRARSDLVADGDRVEIYRALTVDANQARLGRAAKKKAERR